jgi:hypothetical protein
MGRTECGVESIEHHVEAQEFNRQLELGDGILRALCPFR